MPSSQWATTSTPGAATATPTDLASGVSVSTLNNDDILSRAKKPQLITDYNAELQVQTQLDAQGTALGVSTTSYDSGVAALTSFLQGLGGTGPAWNFLDVTTDTPMGAGGGATLRNDWNTVAARRALLQKALTDTIQNNAAYADALARSSNNVIKNGTSELANPSGPEAAGVVSGNAFTGSKCRAVAADTVGTIVVVTAPIPCNVGDQVIFTAKGKGSGAGCSQRLMIQWLDATGAANGTSVGPTISGAVYQDCTTTVSGVGATAPAGTAAYTLGLENRTAVAGGFVYFDNLFAGRMVSAAMFEADLGIFGVIRSGGNSSGTGLYVPGSAGNAPVGFKISAFPFTCTYIDGATDSTCQMELGGSANFGGYKVATINTRVMTAFNRVVNGSFYQDLTGWNAASGTVPVLYNAATSDTGTGSASVTAPNATAVAGRISQAFAIPPSSTTINLTLKTACTMDGAGTSAGGAITVTITNMDTGVSVAGATWTYPYGTQPTSPSWTARSVDVTSILSGGGSFLLTVGFNTVKGDATGTGTVYIDNIKIVL